MEDDEFPLTDHLFKVAAANTVSFTWEMQDAMEYMENRMHGFWQFKGYDLEGETAADCIQMLRYFVMDVQECTRSPTSTLKGRFGFDTRGKFTGHRINCSLKLNS
jgi:hypothetical protein